MSGSYGDREYTANWKPNEYTFTLNANGGTVSSFSISANYNASYTLPTPTRDYYTFAGWYDGTKKYENGTWDKASNVTLTAKWTPVSYTITYNLSGGTNSSQNVKDFTVESSKISLKDPTRTGYKFVGWYKESSYSNKVMIYKKAFSPFRKKRILSTSLSATRKPITTVAERLTACLPMICITS
ncbi:MAG: InlB B-repeat-containing protein [Clostridia bacterium]|nr:InlB B-repeat-containing protein [Clostridia bacterium]